LEDLEKTRDLRENSGSPDGIGSKQRTLGCYSIFRIVILAMICVSPIFFTQGPRNSNALLVGFVLFAFPFLCLVLSLLSVQSEEDARSISKISGIAAIFGFLTLLFTLGGHPDAFGALKLFIGGVAHNFVAFSMYVAVRLSSLRKSRRDEEAKSRYDAKARHLGSKDT